MNTSPCLTGHLSQQCVSQPSSAFTPTHEHQGLHIWICPIAALGFSYLPLPFQSRRKCTPWWLFRDTVVIKIVRQPLAAAIRHDVRGMLGASHPSHLLTDCQMAAADSPFLYWYAPCAPVVEARFGTPFVPSDPSQASSTRAT